MAVIAAYPLLWSALGLILVTGCLSILRDRRHKRRLAEEGPRYWWRIFAEFHLLLWAWAVLCCLAWDVEGLPVAALGLKGSAGLFWWGAWGVCVLIGGYTAYSAIAVVASPAQRQSIAEALKGAGDLSMLTPRTPAQLGGFFAISATAGITEELVFRGFLIGVLALFLPLPLAGGLAAVVFLLGHAYQGVSGILRIVPITVILTAMFVLSGSLWPGMVLHFFVDAAGGVMLYFSRPEKLVR